MKENPTVTISGLGSLALLSVVFLAFLLRERRNRRRIEERLARILESVSADALSWRALEQEVLGHRSREQRRIANELHGGVSQNLAGIAMLLKGLEQRSQAEASVPTKDITRIADLIKKTSVKAQDLLLGRESTSGAAVSDLVTALHELAARTRLLFRIPCSFEGMASPQLETMAIHQLLAIAEEAVTNAVRHAYADQITLHLESEGGTLILAVEDDGNGFARQAQNLHARGQRVMAVRTEKLDGHLTILPRTPRGTRVECRIPWPGVPEEP